MIITRPICGVVPVIQTPISSDGTIDEEGQRHLIEYLGNLDIGGYWALGTGSEDMNLTFDQRLQIAQVISDANAGKKPLVMGAGFYAMGDILAFIDAIKDMEFDAYHIMPYHPLLSLERLDWFYRHIADRAPKPVWMYYSSNWSKKITPGFVADLKEHPNIAGIKFSSRDTIDQMKVIAMQHEGFQVITAVIGQFFASLSMGVKAGTSSLAGCLPEPIIEIYDLFQAGKVDEAMAAQRRFMAFTDDLPKGLKADNFLGAAEEKVILSIRGLIQPFTTSYYRDANANEVVQIEQALKKHGMPTSV